jgi:thiol:disulfide interchange protein DsbD
LLAFALYIGWPQARDTGGVQWEPWSHERIAQLQSDKRAIFVDFTARWCATCQANKKLVFSSKKVRDVFQDRNIALLKGDWTNSDPLITAELAKWGRSAVPFNLLYLPGHAEPVVLPELLTPSIVLNAVTSGDERTAQR